jgi:hypothetical protein
MCQMSIRPAKQPIILTGRARKNCFIETPAACSFPRDHFEDLTVCRANILTKGSSASLYPLCVAMSSRLQIFAEFAALYYYLPMRNSVCLIMFLFALAVVTSHADQVIMQNGDILNGKVLTLSTNVLVLQDDNLGKVTLLRGKVANIIFGTVAVPVPASTGTNAIEMRQAPIPQTNSDSDLETMLRGIRNNTNLIQQVEGQVLGSSSPDAVNKFNELLDGLSSGKIDMNDLRAQAQSTADQLREYKKEMGPADTAEADAYLAILDDFLKETAPGNEITNAAAP